ncbi:MAG: sugar-binding domain-containing protein, partial [Armatimonadota bacterium]
MCAVAAVEPGPTPPSDAVWQKLKVPSLQPNDKGHCAWYRRAFDAPAQLQGERLLLRFDQTLTEGWVYLNGQAVGHELHGSQPFTVDVTAAYRPGQRNELLVAVRDWIAYSPRNQERVRRGEAPIYKDGMVDVAGYLAAGSLGLGGPVYLAARPAVAVEDVFIVTSVRHQQLSLRYRLRNDGATAQTVKLSAQVLDAGKSLKSLPAVSLTIPAHGTVTKTLETPWADPKLWWPEDPHLYNLQTDLKPTSGASDRLVTRFGFRELWIDGIAFMLNGVRTKIRSQWASSAGGTWPMAPFTDPGERAAAAWAWQERWVNEGAHQLTRTHGQAGVQELCDVADETGLMIKLESECNQVSFTFDQRFWNAVIAHELHVMDVYKNHPAVTMWSAGNENMWGWIYQGEAAKVLGNRWQIKTVKAMREFDLMRRPIEWEADGDLMGGWEHHALHYPRELTDSPGVPTSAWWGPLDGKTVVPYSMGPITLGQKPLTVGEAFWPANLNKPLGATVIVGDEAYASTQAYGRAWMESSAFFVNGFRDVEFALIDIYNPLWLIAPQSIVLKQEDRAFYGGQTLRRDLNIHNDVRVPARLTLRWSLTMGAQKKAGAEQTLALSPAELKRLSLSIPLPAVGEVTPAQLRIELLDHGQLVHVETRDWRLYPQAKLTTPAGLKLSVYDPLGETAQALRTAGVPFALQTQLKAPAQGALLLGRDSLKQAPEGPWREELLGFVRGGGKLVILEQSDPPDFLPVPLTAAKQRKLTMAYARATDHPLLAGLDDWALRWWAPDHYVSAGNYRKPSQGNFLPLIDAGTGEGIIESPLLEEYEGKGSIVLCQMLLTDKLGAAPQATLLWQNLLSYLAAPLPFRQGGATALFAGADSPLRKALRDSAVIFTDLTGKAEQLKSPAYQVALVDVATALDEGLTSALRQFAQGGGHVLLHRATPDQQKLVEAALGCRVRFFSVKSEPEDTQNHVVRGPSAGLLSGLSNHEFFWASNAYYAIARHEGDWWTGYEGGCPPAEYVADYFCAPVDDASGVSELTRPGALLQAPCGSGYVALSQMRLDEPVADCAVTVARLRSLLLTNLGCTLQGSGGAQRARQQRLQQYDFFSVDLSAAANRGLKDDKGTGLVGWTNQGENDMRALPTGRQVLAGIPFQIMSPKGAIVLFSTNANNADLPKEVKGLKVGRKADVLFFLHSVAWGNEKPFRYRVNYDDGTTTDVPVINGQQIVDWWQDPAVWADSLARGGG